MTEGQRLFTGIAILTLAGPVAEARARRPNQDGWVLLLSPERRIAIHEAGHAIAAAAVGHFIQHLSIVPNPERRTPGNQYFSGGFCFATIKAEEILPEDKGPVTRDCTTITNAALLLTPWDTPLPLWKAVRATVRRLRKDTETLIDAHWLQVMALASELERQKTMDRSAIEPYVKRLRVQGAEISLLSEAHC